jgi:hypothetical protein
MMDGFFGNIPGYLPVFAMQNKTDTDFLKLPEETQQDLLKRGADSGEELRRRMDELSLKE